MWVNYDMDFSLMIDQLVGIINFLNTHAGAAMVILTIVIAAVALFSFLSSLGFFAPKALIQGKITSFIITPGFSSSSRGLDSSVTKITGTAFTVGASIISLNNDVKIDDINALIKYKDGTTSSLKLITVGAKVKSLDGNCIEVPLEYDLLNTSIFEKNKPKIYYFRAVDEKDTYIHNKQIDSIELIILDFNKKTYNVELQLKAPERMLASFLKPC